MLFKFSSTLKYKIINIGKQDNFNEILIMVMVMVTIYKYTYLVVFNTNNIKRVPNPTALSMHYD